MGGGAKTIVAPPQRKFGGGPVPLVSTGSGPHESRRVVKIFTEWMMVIDDAVRDQNFFGEGAQTIRGAFNNFLLILQYIINLKRFN